MQVTPENPMDGIDGRANLLLSLSTVLISSKSSKYFRRPTSSDDPTIGTYRPGHMIDFLLSHPTSQQIPSPSSYKIAVQIETMWDIVVNGLSEVWPESRTKLGGKGLGDVWPAEVLEGEDNSKGENLVPFHKLSQWLTYSLIEV